VRPPEARRATRNTQHATRSSAFSLLELLVVVAIMAIVMTVGIPFIRTAVDTPRGMKGAFKALDDACQAARAYAILQQTTTELRITSEGSIEINAVGTKGSDRSSPTAERADQEHTAERASKKAIGKGGGPRKLPEGVGIEAILANGQDVTDEGEARIRFFSNGTSDELQLVLSHPESGQKRQVWLDMVTGTLDFETDPHKFKLQ
jgi:prepilin-type N-terminal cleavage/methylation domain-containing protein